MAGGEANKPFPVEPCHSPSPCWDLIRGLAGLSTGQFNTCRHASQAGLILVKQNQPPGPKRAGGAGWHDRLKKLRPNKSNHQFNYVI
jgi:hypothetical protein